MPGSIYYSYFPEARSRDLADFWPSRRIAKEMRTVGFEAVTTKREHTGFDHSLADFLETTRRRENNSQLPTLSDAAYEAGLRLIESRVTDSDAPRTHSDHLCFLTILGDKPGNIV